MKLLKLKTTTGFKMLEKDFEINLLSKTRVDKESVNDDLLELEEDFFYPIETILIGKNSSGKTTTLELIYIAFEILNEGRVRKDHFNIDEEFGIEIVFYKSGIIYKYSANYRNDTLADKMFLTIVDESLVKTTNKDSYKKDLSNASYFKVSDFTSNVGGDTSLIVRYSNDGSFNYHLDLLGNKTFYFKLFYEWLGKKVFDAILHLFDDSVEYIRPFEDESNKDAYKFKRKGEQERIVVSGYLNSILSKGTIRGINLYTLSILTFLHGGHLLVDELEGSFNRNLIENLILMYNDKTINKGNGSIIYSTHYAELLDSNSRCDNVNILHRDGTKINIKNMCLDYKIRTEMLKSSKFNQNTFDTLINYERLMDLKDAIRER